MAIGIRAHTEKWRKVIQTARTNPGLGTGGSNFAREINLLVILRACEASVPHIRMGSKDCALGR
jgi:hypothetical protein